MPVSAQPTQDFSGRVALVTGASRGLGRAAAVRLIERGARVAINVRDDTRATAVAGEIGSVRGSGRRHRAGVPASLVARTVEQFGRLDVLVNNAAFANYHAVRTADRRGMAAWRLK